MALPAAATYDKMDRPYNASMQRSVFSDAVTNVPGTTQEEGGRTIKTGEALTDVWIDTWIKSRTYQPKSQGFMLDSKGGYIECMDFSIGTGIDMYGNDAYFYDYTEASGGTYVKTATASLNFMRKYYEDQNFIMQKRVGYHSPSADQSDNVFEMFYENAPQSGRRNYIFIGTKGDTSSAGQEHTDVLRLHGTQMMQFDTNTLYNQASELTIWNGNAPAATFDPNSVRVQFLCKDSGSRAYFDPANLGNWRAGVIYFGAFDPTLPANGNDLLIMDNGGIWQGVDIKPMVTNTLSLGSALYKYKDVFSGNFTATGFIKAPVHYFDGTHYIQYTGSNVEINAPLYVGNSVTAGGDVIATGNLQCSGGVVRVGGTYFTAQSITYKNGSGTNSTRTFLVA